MEKSVSQYIADINKRYRLGNATEHTFRGDLQQLMETLVPGIRATNEPKRQACGAPDYILTKKDDIAVGYIEAKDIGADLNSNLYKEQFDRYRAALNNLMITDYLHFDFYRDGEYTTTIKIGEIRNGKIVPLPANFSKFENLIKDFCVYLGQTIKSPRKLAEMMAAKARMLADVIEKSLKSDEVNQENSTLQEQLLSFRQVLIHDIKPEEFADMYAQTIAYGMFAARLNDPSLDSFTRLEAATLIPKTNPFLGNFFQYVSGFNLDSRISWIVDGLAEVFRATDITELLKNFGSSTETKDPIIHFYETFLFAYDPALRKARGVWYTPDPVSNFIVRAIDDILQSEFGLAAGIADSSMTMIKVHQPGLKKPVEKQVHKVQFLDPATGTATFLAEIVKQVHGKFKGQEGIWSDYVEQHLIPRLNGFEILMASYAMAHLKLDLLLKETGYVPKNEQRFRIYLTNSLEEYQDEVGPLFVSWLSTEAREANLVKRETPVMVVVGNPPYSVSSINKSAWIQNLISDYKKDLNEKNIQPLSDDYIKFIRYGQYLIDKNGTGIVAFISNNSFIDGLIHRQMRKSLLESFDKIFIFDLHGNAKKKELCPDGSPDQNVFDIMQGVSINIFVKTGKKEEDELGQVFQSDLYGSRENKYQKLIDSNIQSYYWDKLNYISPNYFFTKKDFKELVSYELGFKVDILFRSNACGIVTARDALLVHKNQRDLETVINDFSILGEASFQNKYNIGADSRDWTYANAKEDLANATIQKIDYRPFDSRYIIYSEKSKGILSYPRNEIMRHMLPTNNLGLLVCKQQSTFDFQHVFVTNKLSDKCSVSLQTKEATYHFPLYLYPAFNAQQTSSQPSNRTPNIDAKIVKQIADKLGLVFTHEKEDTNGTFAPIDILDYIYAVLHSPNYREKYKEFLKIDFPRVPYPADRESFLALVALGSELRQIHLLESPVVSRFITQYPVGGSNEVEKVRYENGNVFINKTQHFANVPEIAWNFYIGGYQPARKWLKDRKGRKLEYDDILHYQKIIVALVETDRIMKEIDEKVDVCGSA